MGNAALKMVSKKGRDKMVSNHSMLHEIAISPILPPGGTANPLASYLENKKAILCVNVASK